MDNIEFDCRWSTNVDDKFIKDFIYIEDLIFQNGYSKELFNKKFINNPYGASIVEIVYINKKPAAARALWRNDIGNRESYQPGDTCVTKSYRGKGVFTEMTKRAIAMLPEGVLIYNFPNQNSYPGYMKMGWKLIGEYYLLPLISSRKFLKEHPTRLPKDYADWWIKDSKNLLSAKIRNEYYLVKKLSKPLCYQVCACTDAEIAQRYPRMLFGICFYYSLKKTFYNKHLGIPLHIVAKNADNVYIPLWKMDVL